MSPMGNGPQLFSRSNITLSQNAMGKNLSKSHVKYNFKAPHRNMVWHEDLTSKTFSKRSVGPLFQQACHASSYGHSQCNPSEHAQNRTVDKVSNHLWNYHKFAKGFCTACWASWHVKQSICPNNSGQHHLIKTPFQFLFRGLIVGVEGHLLYCAKCQSITAKRSSNPLVPRQNPHSQWFKGQFTSPVLLKVNVGQPCFISIPASAAPPVMSLSRLSSTS